MSSVKTRGTLKRYAKAASWYFPNHAVFKRVISLTSFQEQQTGELKLPAEEEFLIRRLLCHRYTTGYNDEPYDDEKDPPTHIMAPAYVNRLYLNAQMYSIADKYDLISLKEGAADKFDVAILNIQAQQRMKPPLGASLVHEIIEAIPLIYSSTPETDSGLRDIVIEVLIYKWRDFENHPGLQDLLASVPDFSEERRTIASGLLGSPRGWLGPSVS